MGVDIAYDNAKMILVERILFFLSSFICMYVPMPKYLELELMLYIKILKSGNQEFLTNAIL